MTDVLFVTVDSLRADHVGWHGYERETTPNLDEIAEDCATFSNAFAHACSTRPSFPSILTSSYALEHGGFERLSSNRATLAEAFSNAGYQTAGFHSNPYLLSDFGYDRGFDRFYDSNSDPTLFARLRQGIKNQFDSEGTVYTLLQRAFNATERHTGIELGSPYVPADELTDRALSWAGDTRAGDRFLWIHYMDVHHPYTPPARHQRAFRDDVIDDDQAIQLRRKMLEEPADVTEEELQQLIDLYDAEIRFVDDEIERLMTSIQRDWDTDPLFVFTADHGEAFREHGSFSHSATFYDEVLHVPLLIDGVQTVEGSDALVGLLDLAPTIVDAVDIEVPSTFRGDSLVGGGHHDRDQVIAEWADYEADQRRFGLRTDDWKYVRLEDSRERLFYLHADPDEMSNLVDSEPETLSTFRDVIDDHAAEVAGEALGADMDDAVRQRLRNLGYQE